jgi:transposase InsO family protein
MHPVAVLCLIAKVSRSGYYKFLARPDNQFDADRELVECINAIQDKVKHIYGYRRMKTAVEKQLKVVVNKKRMARIQKEHQLQAQVRRKRFKYPQLTFAIEAPKANLLNRQFNAEAPNQKWVTDITYLQKGDTRLYLSVILDLFNKEIISYRISDTLAIPFVLETFEDAFARVQPEQVLVHSDQGCHYTATIFCAMLRGKNAVQSMSRRGNCWDNAIVENFFGHLKSEMVRRLQPCSKADLEKHVHDYINFYNTIRIQGKMKMAPVEHRSHFMQTT